MANNDYFAWDDTIENDSEFTLLEEGDYNFEIQDLNKTYASSGAPMAVLTVKVFNDTSSSTLRENLVLQRNCEWKLSEFFRSIGQKKHGEPLKMDWSKVKGATGRCKVVRGTFTGRDGQERDKNEINKFYDPAPSATENKTTELPW